MQVYPTLVIRGTGLYELWKKGLYRNYEPTQLIDLVARILALVPPWVRIYRIQVPADMLLLLLLLLVCRLLGLGLLEQCTNNMQFFSTVCTTACWNPRPGQHHHSMLRSIPSSRQRSVTFGCRRQQLVVFTASLQKCTCLTPRTLLAQWFQGTSPSGRCWAQRLCS